MHFFIFFPTCSNFLKDKSFKKSKGGGVEGERERERGRERESQEDFPLNAGLGSRTQDHGLS